MGSEYQSSSDGEKDQNAQNEPEDSWSESSDEFGEYGEENAHLVQLGEIVMPEGDQADGNKTIAIEASQTPSRNADEKSPLAVRTDKEPISR